MSAYLDEQENEASEESVVGTEGKIDKFDELKKYKELFDQNIISQEEFEEKKKKILEL